MTPEDKITQLVEYIKKELPNGCAGIECENCPLDTRFDTIESDVCSMLAAIKTRPNPDR